MELISAVNIVGKYLGDHVGESISASELWQAWFTVRAKIFEVQKTAYNSRVMPCLCDSCELSGGCHVVDQGVKVFECKRFSART